MNFKPILFEEFEKELNEIACFEDYPHLGLSLSGGPDSLALMCLLKIWVHKNNGKLTAFNVNHKIRFNSNEESIKVKNIAEKSGIECIVLNWDNEKPRAGLMECARDKRYELILNECKKRKILHLMLGHHLNDNAETYIMRSKRIGNLTGLTSIPLIREMKHLRLIRPLLKFRKERLLKTCTYFGKKWIDDPSNSDSLYERVRVRQCLSSKAKNTINQISMKIKKKILERKRIENTVSNFFINFSEFFPYGVFKTNKSEFLKLSKEEQLIIIKKLLVTNSATIYPPKKKSVEFLVNQIIEKDFSVNTLHSSIIKIQKKNLFVFREHSKTSKNMSLELFVNKGISLKWDQRFTIFSNKYDLKCNIINQKNWDRIREYFFKKKKRILPLSIIKSLPIISVEKLYFIPYISNSNDLKKYDINFFFNPPITLTSNNF